MGLSTKLNNVTICFPHLFQKHAAPGTDNAKYGAEFLLDPAKHADLLKELDATFRRVATEAGKADRLQYMKSPVKSGDEVNADRQAKGKEPRPELVGMYVLRASDPTSAPAVVNARMQPLSDAQQSQVFGGCVVNAFVDLYYSSNATNPGVYSGLKGVQLVDNVNVEPLGGGRPSVDQMFGVIEGAPEPVQTSPTGGPAQDGDLPSFM